MDSLLRFTFAPLIRSLHSLVDAKPLIDLLKNSPGQLVDTLLCLVELVDLILGGGSGDPSSGGGSNNPTTRLSKLDQDKVLVDADLTRLFVGFTAYFQLRTSPLFAAKHKLTLYIDSVVFRLARHVQKCLLKSVVNRDSSQHQQQQQNQKDDLDRLISAYFRMLFAFVSQPNTDLNTTYEQKIATVEMAAQFWRALNARLKRSLELGQFLLARLCRAWTANFYFRTIPTTNPTTSTTPVSSTSTCSSSSSGCSPAVVVAVFQSPGALTREQFVRFTHAVLAFVNEIIQMSVVADLECLVYLHVMFHLTRCDKLRKQSKKYTNFTLSNEHALDDEVFALECGTNLRLFYSKLSYL